MLRAVMVFGGLESARRPKDYFNLAQPSFVGEMSGDGHEPQQVQVER